MTSDSFEDYTDFDDRADDARPLTDDLLREVVEKLRVDAGLEASLEYPGCVVIPHADPERGAWWFGTANETWGGDLMTPDGCVDVTIPLTVPSASQEAGAIAREIAGALLLPDGGRRR